MPSRSRPPICNSADRDLIRSERSGWTFSGAGGSCFADGSGLAVDGLVLVHDPGFAVGTQAQSDAGAGDGGPGAAVPGPQTVAAAETVGAHDGHHAVRPHANVVRRSRQFDPAARSSLVYLPPGVDHPGLPVGPDGYSTPAAID